MDKDLSTHHAPVGDLFTLPAAPAEWEQYRLSDEQVSFFNEYGYLKNIRVLTNDQVDALCAEVDELMTPAQANNPLWYEHHSNESTVPDLILFHALGAWRIRAGLHDVLWNPAFTAAATQLLGGAVRFWHDQLFCKPARHGGVVAWHQDYSYWTRTQPMAHLTCHIALDDATTENGCLHYVPRSHKWDLLPRVGLAGDMEAIQSVLNDEQRAEFRPVAIELKRGECSFHHPLMLHGSYSNKSARARRATVINVFLDGVRSASGAPLLDGVPVIPAGEKMSGQFFPLLFDPNSGDS
jgi:ectoine hydroxylase-related dioxygenase (phytanoyl-CoA dioxygenase family)